MNFKTHIDSMPDGRDTARWVQRLTAAGFTFFLVKGLFWIALAVWAVA